MRISLSILDESPSCKVEYNPVYILEELPQEQEGVNQTVLVSQAGKLVGGRSNISANFEWIA